MILAMFAAAILLQPAEETPPPEVEQAGQAWADCIGAGVDAAPARGSERAAARAILTNCRTLQNRMVAAYGSWVNASSLSDADKRSAIAATQRTIDGMEAQITAAIRASRAD